jgi:hypothetical protein
MASWVIISPRSSLVSTSLAGIFASLFSLNVLQIGLCPTLRIWTCQPLPFLEIVAMYTPSPHFGHTAPRNQVDSGAAVAGRNSGGQAETAHKVLIL